MFIHNKNIKKIILITSIIFTGILSNGCSYIGPASLTPVTKSGFYFDTIISVTLYGTGKGKYLEGCMALAKKYDKLLSVSDKDSEISAVNSNPGKPVTVSDDTIDIISKALEYAKLSDGLFDPTVGELTSLWEFHEDEDKLSSSASDRPGRIPDKNEIQRSLKSIDYNNIIINGNTITLTKGKLDPGGIAKGYIADRIKDYLEANDIHSGIINLGGNILLLDEKPGGGKYTVGIQKPFSTEGESAYKLKLTGKSIVTSGIYERYFEADGKIYHHILDPRTGYPVDNGITSLTVISDSSCDADALSTTLFLMGTDKALEYANSNEDVDVIIITDDDEIISSDGAQNYME